MEFAGITFFEEAEESINVSSFYSKDSIWKVNINIHKSDSMSGVSIHLRSIRSLDKIIRDLMNARYSLENAENTPAEAE